MSGAFARRAARATRLVGGCAFAVMLVGLSASAATGLGPIGFEEHSGYSGGAAPAGIAVFDANGDGRSDVVQTSDADGSARVELLPNDGSGGLLSAVHSTCSLRTTSITHADFDRDGKEDVAVCGPYAPTVAVGYGDGLGQFSFEWTGTTGAAPACVIAGDWNRDGAPDVAVADSASVKVFLRSGAGFGVPTAVALGVAPTRLALGDIDRDGDTDLLAGGASSVVALVNDGSGGFSAGERIDFAEAMAALTAADFDGDSILDIGVATSAGGIEVWRGVGDGSFGQIDTVSAGGAPYELAAVDLDLDGDLDLAATVSDTDRVELFENDAHGDMSAAGHVSVGNSPEGLALARMDRDGRADVVVANTAHGSIGVALNTTPQLHGVGYADVVHVPTPGNPWASTTGDFDRDGHPDIATVERYSNTLRVLLGDGTGGLVVTASIPVGLYPTGVASGDINGDGIADLVVSNGNFGTVSGENKVSVLLGQGDGDFVAQSACAVGSQPLDVGLGDFDRDGKLDLCTVNPGAGSVSVRLGDGAGAFPTGDDTGSLSDPMALRVADFDGDGKLDIVTVNMNDNSVAVLLGDGSGGFSQTTIPVPGVGGACTLAVGDFDDNGVPDLAVADTSGRIARLLGSGTGSFSGSAVATAGSGIGRRSLAIADTDGDGHDDILVTADCTAGHALLGDGSGKFAAPLGVTEIQALSPILVDLNHDGRLDVVQCSLFANRVSVHLGDTFAPTTTLRFSSAANGPDGWYVNYAPYLKLETAESATHYYQFDATGTAGWQVASDDWFPLTAEGTHTVYYFSADSLGNTETVRSQMIKWDGSPPSGTAAIAHGATYVSTSTVSIDSTLTDVLDARFSSGWGQPWSEWEPYSKHRMITLNPPTGEGSRFAFAEYRDDHGLVTRFDLETHIDLGPPSCAAIKTPSTDWSNTATVSVDIATWDMSGIESVTYEIDGGATEAFTEPLEFSAEGSHTISYRARDNAGYTSATQTIAVRLDRTKPTAVTLSSSTNPTSSAGWCVFGYGSVDIAGQSDELSGLKGLSVTVTTATPSVPDNVTDMSASATHVEAWLDQEPDGVPWYVGVSAVDNAGNLSDPAYYGPIARDTTAPRVLCDSDDAWHSQPVTVTISVEDTLSGPGRVGYNPGDGDHDYVGPLGFSDEGVHGFQCWGYDVAGNWTYGGYHAVFLDFTAPAPASFVSSSHEEGVWSGSPLVSTQVLCADVDGHGVQSGISGYSTAWSQSTSPTVDDSIDMLTD